MGKFYDITGQRFGRLIVKRRGENQNKHIMYYCDCDCGNKDILIRKDSLIDGNTQSCGCLAIERRTESSKMACKKSNKYKLLENYGVGWTSNTNEEFYFDLEDYEIVKDFCWSKDKNGYIRTFNSGHNLFLHRLVTGAYVLDPYKYVVDHINHDKSDNRKENLRIVTQIQNSENHKLKCNNTSGKSGVWWSNRDNCWCVQIKVNGKSISGGYFKDKESAFKRRNELEDEYFKEYSYKNSLMAVNKIIDTEIKMIGDDEDGEEL